MCTGARNENEDNQVADVESADCHRSVSAMESLGVQREMEKRRRKNEGRTVQSY